MSGGEALNSNRREVHNGGEIFLHAGPTQSQKGIGGNVKIFAGAGKNDNRLHGSKGGSIDMVGGIAFTDSGVSKIQIGNYIFL